MNALKGRSSQVRARKHSADDRNSGWVHDCRQAKPGAGVSMLLIALQTKAL